MNDITETKLGYTVRKVIQVVLLSLVVGGFLTLIGLTPMETVNSLLGFGRDAVNVLLAAFGTAGTYIVTGAIFVVPLYLVTKLIGMVRQ